MISSHRSGFITSDHACGQGAGRIESGATSTGCEHVEQPATQPPGVRRGYEITSDEDSGAPERRFDQVAGDLIARAARLGASAAAVIAVDRIVIEDDLASLCREPRCENFGLSASCPPHVPGPAKLREWMKISKGAVFFKIEVPSDSLFSDDWREIMGLLHDIAAQIEQHAVERGYANSRAFAGGSCKMIFCREQSNCAVLANEKCRNPAIARPSMSGFGVNVGKLIEASGWRNGDLQSGGAGKHGSFVALYGLVLIG